MSKSDDYQIVLDLRVKSIGPCEAENKITLEGVSLTPQEAQRLGAAGLGFSVLMYATTASASSVESRKAGIGGRSAYPVGPTPVVSALTT